VRFEAIYGNIREANRGSAFSTEASLEQAGSKCAVVFFITLLMERQHD
jgi:hypothetical protein